MTSPSCYVYLREHPQGSVLVAPKFYGIGASGTGYGLRERMGSSLDYARPALRGKVGNVAIET
jgi:hypothetical protein